MTLTETAETRAMWPTAFIARQTITLNAGNKLTATLTVENPDKAPFEFTSSFHTYFAANIAEVAVEGLSGLKMLDRVAKPPAEGTAPAGAVSIKGPVDSVYYNAPKSITLKTGGGKSVGIKAGGWPDAVVWSPWTDMEACYKEFVAVENAAVGAPVKVAPGGSWSGSMELTAA
jgi:D-hexose-6-phosphate mutarotase